MDEHALWEKTSITYAKLMRVLWSAAAKGKGAAPPSAPAPENLATGRCSVHIVNSVFTAAWKDSFLKIKIKMNETRRSSRCSWVRKAAVLVV
jgi:hypothetical protein